VEIHIRSAGTAVPGPAIDNATLTRHFGMPVAWEQWIDTFVGTHTRHFAVDLATGEIRTSLADLAEAAGRRALTSAGLAPADVDLIVMATSSPDMLMPATVNLVADRLGVNDLPTYQLQSGCAGAVQAFDVATQLMRSGQYRTALVIGADTCAKHLETTVDPTTLAPAEQVNGMLFGDGAGAVVLSDTASADSAVLRHAFVRFVGLGRPPGQVVDWFGRADRHIERPAVLEDYKAIEESVPVLAAEALEQVLAFLDWKESDVDYLLPPQLSGRMTKRITDRLDLPGAKEISCVADTGNTGNALPFFQLERTLPRLVTGDRAVGVAIESSKWIKAGFALEKL
jgi:3-oxoacyl-[acyl-carrier-protein] synthase-3